MEVINSYTPLVSLSHRQLEGRLYNRMVKAFSLNELDILVTKSGENTGCPKDVLLSVAQKAATVSEVSFLEFPRPNAQALQFIISPHADDRRIYFISPKQIGSGTFGIVKKAYELVTGEGEFVVKVPNLERESSKGPQVWKEKANEALMNEARALQEIYRKVNVTEGAVLGLPPLPQVILDQPNFRAIVYEQFTMDMHQAIDLQRRKWNTQQLVDLFHQIFSGLAKLDELNTMHNDMSPRNFAIDSNKNRYFPFDFSFAKSLNQLPEQHQRVDGYTSHFDRDSWYEYVSKNDLKRYQALMKSRDLFGAAVSIYKLILHTHSFPYVYSNGYAHEPINFDKKALEEVGLPPALISMLEKCLKLRYLERPTAQDVLDVVSLFR